MNKLTQSMQSFLKDFIEDESGLTAVEYAIAGGLVVGGMVGAFVSLGDAATGRVNDLGCAIESGGSYNPGSAEVLDDPDTQADEGVDAVAASCN